MEASLIEITDKPISPEIVIDSVKNYSSGCVVTYVGLIRHTSQGKKVLSVEYEDSEGNAVDTLREIAKEAKERWQVEDIAFVHRVGKLKVGDINLVIAVAAAHRVEGFASCQYIIDQFKERRPTRKVETYLNGETYGV